MSAGTATPKKSPSFHPAPLKIIDPVEFLRWNWPHIRIYKEQREILYSVRDNDETFVPAGNQLGKDFIAAYCVLWFFLSRQSRVVTTSVKHDQLKDVLWGEIRRFLDTSKHELPVIVNHLHLRRTDANGDPIPLWELVGQVSNQKEGLLGRHLQRGPCNEPTTLAVFDEASGIDDNTFESTETWAHRKLAIGNCFPCQNFFFRGTEGGDIPRPNGKGFYRKIIRIRADDSPNVKLARREIELGKEPSEKILIPGLKDYPTLQKHRQLWDEVLQCIGLDAQFYKGGSILLYPPDWLNRAEQIALSLRSKKRTGRTIGVDPAEGGDSTVWTVIDEFGIIEQIGMKTKDTSVIPNTTLMLMKKYKVDAANVVFDRGGGGKQHADVLRTMGHFVRTVAFGESASAEMTPFPTFLSFRQEVDRAETQYTFANRRAQMYWLLRQMIDPQYNEQGFGIPQEYTELRSQLAPIPLTFGNEGRIELLPKNSSSKNGESLTSLIGHSPDEADSLVLAIFGMLYPNPAKTKAFVGAIS